MYSERRKAYRFHLDQSEETAVLKIGNTELIVHLLEKSSTGFGAVVDPDSTNAQGLEQGQTGLLATQNSCSQVEIARLELHDGQLQLGLRCLGEVRTQTALSRGSWGSLTPKKMFSNTLNVVKVLVVFAVCCILIAWGMSYSDLIWQVDTPPPRQRIGIQQEIVQANRNDTHQQRKERLIARLLRLDKLQTSEFSRQFQLNPQQQQRMTEIALAAGKTLNAIYREHPQADMETITTLCLEQISKIWQQVDELLNDEQKKQWAEMNAEADDLVPVNTQADVN